MSQYLFGTKFVSLGQLADEIFIGNFVDIPILIFLQFFFPFLMFMLIFPNLSFNLLPSLIM